MKGGVGLQVVLSDPQDLTVTHLGRLRSSPKDTNLDELWASLGWFAKLPNENHYSRLTGGHGSYR